MTAKSRRPARYDVGIDSYRSAKILTDAHGAMAKAQAGQRMQELLDAGDEAGAWADILFAIEEMQRGPRRDDRRH